MNKDVQEFIEKYRDKSVGAVMHSNGQVGSLEEVQKKKCLSDLIALIEKVLPTEIDVNSTNRYDRGGEFTDMNAFMKGAMWEREVALKRLKGE